MVKDRVEYIVRVDNGKDKNVEEYIVRVGLVRITMGGVHCQGRPGKDKDGMEYIVRKVRVIIRLG